MLYRLLLCLVVPGLRHGLPPSDQMEQYSTKLAPGADEVEMRFQVPGFESMLAFAGIGVMFIARKLFS